MSTSAGSSATPPGGHPLDRHRGKMGKMPDADVAAIAGVSVDEVKLYRREHNIAAFLRPPPGSKGANSGQPVRLVRPGATPGSITSAAAPPAAAPSGLEAHRHRLGQVADQVIADEVGVSRGVVGAYRRKLGIKAYEGYLFPPGHRPPAARMDEAGTQSERVAEPAAATAPASGRSTIDPYLDLLGTVPDSEVAALAGVSRAAVAKYRSRRGIPGVEPAPLVLKHGMPAEGPPAMSAPPRSGGDVESPTATSAPRPSRIDPHRAHVGVLPDRAVAELAGVTTEAVRMYRKRHGISAAAGPVPRAAAAAPGLFDAVPAPQSPPTAPEEPGVEPAVPAPATASGAAPELVPAPESSAPVGGAADAAPVAHLPAPTVVASAPSPAVAVPGGVGETRAFHVVAICGDDRRRFACVGADITQGLALAVRALAARTDGPWRVLAIRQGDEALVEPTLAPARAPALAAPSSAALAESPESPRAPAPEAPRAPVAPPARIEGPRPTGDELSRFRRVHGLSQRELGARLGVGQSVVSKAESCGPLAMPEAIALRFEALVRQGAERLVASE